MSTSKPDVTLVNLVMCVCIFLMAPQCYSCPLTDHLPGTVQVVTVVLVVDKYIPCPVYIFFSDISVLISRRLT